MRIISTLHACGVMKINVHLTSTVPGTEGYSVHVFHFLFSHTDLVWICDYLEKYGIPKVYLIRYILSELFPTTLRM